MVSEHTLSQFLNTENRGGSLCLIGGHYDWPGIPTEMAKASATEILGLAKRVDAMECRTLLFLNDIGALCLPSGQCQTNGANHLALSSPEIETWANEFVSEIEREIASTDGDITKYRESLCEMLSSSGLQKESRLGTTMERLCSHQLDESAWAMEVEHLIYHYAKRDFRPLVLAKSCKTVMPDVLFEKSMNNGASRTLHKAMKKNRSPRLFVSKSDDETSDVWNVVGDTGTIQLRQESNVRGIFSASNKCPAILAQLFFNACRKLSHHRDFAEEISILYIVPCYDRARLASGIDAFFAIFEDLQYWFSANRVSISSAFYASPLKNQMLVDTFSLEGKGIVRKSTVRVSSAGRPSTAHRNLDERLVG